MKKILLLGGSAQQVIAIETAKRMGLYTVLCDYLVIASGRTAAQISALADLADEYMAKKDMVLRRTEGQREGRWAVLDYGSIMVHLFHREERAYYGLDRLWNDGSNALDLPFDQTIPD